MKRFENDWRVDMIPEEGVLSRQKMKRRNVWFRRKSHHEQKKEYHKDSRPLNE